MNSATLVRTRSISRFLTGVCLWLAVSGCALVPDFPRDLSGETERVARAEVRGIPPALSSRANEIVRVAEPEARSVLEARNRMNNSAKVLTELLSSEGYLAATVAPSRIENIDDAAVLVAEPGPRFVVLSRDFHGRDALVPEVERQLDAAIASLPPGAAARTPDIERLDTELVEILQKSGYAFARSEGIDVLASRQDANVELTFMLVPGPRVALGELQIPEADARNTTMVRTLKSWSAGDLYTPAIMDQLKTRLQATGLYEGIGLGIAETPGPDGRHPVTATLVEDAPRSIGFGVAASTTEGVGVDGFWERRNLTGRADRLRIQGQVATLAQNVTATYSRPNIGTFGRTLSLDAGVRSEETDAYDLQGVRVGAALTQPFSRELMLSVGAALDATRTTDLRTRIAGIDARDQVTLSFPVALNYSDVGDPLDPQSGFRVFAEADSGISLGDGTPGYTRLHLSGATYRAISRDLVAAVRAEYGAFVGSGAVPPDRLFFAGGGGTVRGYEYQSLSPRNTLGDIEGGRGLFAASAELRWRASERFGFVAFADAGAADSDAGGAFSEASASVGAGVRYYPGFGPIRFDIATPLDRREGDAAVQVYVSIGQAF